MSKAKNLSIDEMDDADSDLGEHHEVTDLEEDQFTETRATKPTKKSGKPARAKKSFPLVPALAAVFVVVGGAVGWQWWSQHHRERPMVADIGARAPGAVGIVATSAPPSGGFMHPPGAPSSAPPAPAMIHTASTPSTLMSPPVTAVPETSGPGLAAVASSPMAAAPVAQAVVVAPHQPEASGDRDAVLNARMDAMQKEISHIAWRISALQSDLGKARPSRKIAAEHAEVVRPQSHRAQVQIVAINNGQAVITADGTFRKVSVGDAIAGMGRVIRVNDAGIQTSGGWIKR